jgi:hypothetical protein
VGGTANERRGGRRGRDGEREAWREGRGVGEGGRRLPYPLHSLLPHAPLGRAPPSTPCLSGVEGGGVPPIPYGRGGAPPMGKEARMRACSMRPSPSQPGGLRGLRDLRDLRGLEGLEGLERLKKTLQESLEEA